MDRAESSRNAVVRGIRSFDARKGSSKGQDYSIGLEERNRTTAREYYYVAMHEDGTCDSIRVYCPKLVTILMDLSQRLHHLSDTHSIFDK